MDDSRFDALARTFTHAHSRRAVFGTLLAGALGLHGIADTTAKKRCSPCKKRKHGGCTGKQPNNTPCPDGTCQDGRCVRSDAPAPADEPPTCQRGNVRDPSPVDPAASASRLGARGAAAWQ